VAATIGRNPYQVTVTGVSLRFGSLTLAVRR
jgi:hypothetical protein